MFILLLIRQFYGQRKIWKILIGILATVTVVALFFIIKNKKNIQFNQSENQKDTPAFIQNSLTYELRAVVWQCAQNIAQQEGFLLTGMGFDVTKDKLVSCYETQIDNPKKKERFVSERFNTHNQFLDFYLSAGFIALLIFLFFIGISFISNRKQFLPTAMLAILLMYCMVENLFHRQIGAYYVGFILIVLMTRIDAEENNKVKNL